MDIQIQQKSERAEYRLPPWLRRPWRHTEKVVEVVKLLKKYKLHTVCQSAGCPNISECFEKPTATFMLLGNVCTRRCRFCGVPKGMPSPPDPDEPDRIGEVASRLGLKHVVITSVTRDDLVDGGADHFLKTINSVKRFNPDITVEALIPDLQGNSSNLEKILGSKLDILNHNLETVPRLYPEIRPQADFERSLGILQESKKIRPDIITKSGLMVGLGESQSELVGVFKNLSEIRCDILTIGQYLSPNMNSVPVVSFVSPDIFHEYREIAIQIGIPVVYAGPYVRSSFHAEDIFRKVKESAIDPSVRNVRRNNSSLSQ